MAQFGKATGADGQDGQNGTDGKDGQDGQDGKDGVTPQLKIEDGYWYISYDNGTTWTQLGKATGEDGKDGIDGEDGKDGQNGTDGKDGQTMEIVLKLCKNKKLRSENYRNIEICGDSTLNQLCQVILEAFDFIDEHLYEFCMDNLEFQLH